MSNILNQSQWYDLYTYSVCPLSVYIMYKECIHVNFFSGKGLKGLKGMVDIKGVTGLGTTMKEKVRET